MKIILFLGSGVSVESGLPSVMELTTKLFEAPYHQDSHNHFIPGVHDDPQMQSVDVTTRVRGLLRLLREHDERDIQRVGYSPSMNRSTGALFRGKNSTYEDLSHLCAQIKFWHIGLVDNSLVTPLMEIIENEARDLLTGSSIMERLSDLGGLAEQACSFIESVVAHELHAKEIVGLDLVLELATAPFVDYLTIVTLNHDTIVEEFLDGHGIDLIDGFSKPDGDVRWYDDSLYDKNAPGVRILKLHGSIDWYSFLVNGKSTRAIFSGPDITNAKNSVGLPLKFQFRRPSFLTGIDKAVGYQRGIFADMHFHFHSLLRECSHMVMSGYGWGDTAMTLRLETWLDHSSNNKIILLHKSPEELLDRSLILASAYDFWKNSGQLIPIPKWLSESTIEDLEPHLISRHSKLT